MYSYHLIEDEIETILVSDPLLIEENKSRRRNIQDNQPFYLIKILKMKYYLLKGIK